MTPTNIDLLKTLMKAQGISARDLAKSVGWASATSANRLLAGEVRTVDPTIAKSIARLLQVQTSLLFAPRVSRNRAQSVTRRTA